MKKFILIGTIASIMSMIVPFHQSETKAETVSNASASQQSLYDQKADAIKNTAMSLKDKVQYNRYVYDPATYQFGCSGFIYYVFKQNGLDLGTKATYLQAELGTYVPKDQLKVGDLVYFSSLASMVPDHNGIYIGDGKIIHNASSTLDVTISDINNGPSYYRTNYVYSKRVIPNLMAKSSPIAEKVASTAESLIGKAKYGSYNESTLTFTSSGFTYYVFKQAGINLGYKSVSYQAKLGSAVAKSNLKKGDLVFFSNSSSNGAPAVVGIYSGNNQVILMAGSQNGVIKAYMGNKWYVDNYVTARRVITQ